MNPATQLDTFRNDQSAPLPRLHEAVERTVEASGHSGDAALRIRSGVTVAEMEKTLILETLRTTDNNRTEAARLLDISIRTLRNKLHEYRAAGVVIEGD
jgi:DNA-binding NtrC family response regulator